MSFEPVKYSAGIACPLKNRNFGKQVSCKTVIGFWDVWCFDVDYHLRGEEELTILPILPNSKTSVQWISSV